MSGTRGVEEAGVLEVLIGVATRARVVQASTNKAAFLLHFGIWTACRFLAPCPKLNSQCCYINSARARSSNRKSASSRQTQRTPPAPPPPPAVEKARRAQVSLPSSRVAKLGESAAS